MAASLNMKDFREKSSHFSLTLGPIERKKNSNILAITA
jgi:hypothetical protein